MALNATDLAAALKTKLLEKYPVPDDASDALRTGMVGTMEKLSSAIAEALVPYFTENAEVTPDGSPAMEVTPDGSPAMEAGGDAVTGKGRVAGKGKLR